MLDGNFMFDKWVDNIRCGDSIINITYTDGDGHTVSKETVTGKYTQFVERLNDKEPLNNLHYVIELENAPILPRFCCYKN